MKNLLDGLFKALPQHFILSLTIGEYAINLCSRHYDIVNDKFIEPRLGIRARSYAYYSNKGFMRTDRIDTDGKPHQYATLGDMLAHDHEEE